MSGIAMLNASFGAAAPAVLVMNLDATVGAMPGSNITTSASFNGSTQYLTLPASTDWALGTGDFTIEWWQYQTGAGTFPRVFSVGTSPTASVAVSIESGTFYFWEGSDGSPKFSSAITGYLNTWVQFAISRISGQTSVYQNGTQIGSTYADTNNINDSSSVLSIGRDLTAVDNTYCPGYISNFRIIKGTGTYTTGFVAPTTTLRAVSGTVALLPLAAAPFMDMSTNLHTITNYGTTTTTASAPTLASATTDFTGTYTITTTNAGATIAYNSANGGVFRKSTSSGADVMVVGPNYVTGQSYSVFMAYKISATSAGRLLNTNSEATKDWLLGAYNGHPKAFYPNFSVNLPSSGADTVWHFSWGTFNTGTSLGQLYTATSTQPIGTSFTGTNGGGGGFNQLRLFSRSGGSEVQTADIGMIRVYNGVVTLAQVQSQYAAFKTRFGY
jgi:hypothetical protein